MILRTVIAAGAVLALASPALAQKAPDKAAAPQGMTLEQFQTKNGDKLFARLDTNKDGKISPEEFAAYRKPKADAPAASATAPGAAATADAKPTKGAKRDQRLFARFDTDNDGFISKAEANAIVAQRFKRLDANNDGVLTVEELQAKGGKAKVGV
ncbi:EF-hand domain-containing protein [uncultured Caulobacter sp.]|uniref:EF-hand domain-containing protein n=1 Tax=uncultured Caulobacter sp. TaxID=158749 RepID=UPI00260FA05A|nr:EF-hand domain-containing protein [uncultured Caulobacter sp.]